MKRQAVIDLSAKEAKKFFLESESYCNFDLPEYFDFKNFLNEVDKFNNGFDLLKAKYKGTSEDTNFVVYNNKDGKYSWRKFQLIHPVLYLQLVKIITTKDNWKTIKEHFSKSNTGNIDSCPIYKRQRKHKKQKKTQILSYLEEIERSSINQSLYYKYLSKLDITDCYSSVYTHSIAWSLHTKLVAKENRKNNFEKKGTKNLLPLFGNDIDFLLEAMQNGQTNGIPEGSILMDFIAEIILTHIDKLLVDKLSSEHIDKYKIIRYRDDYRIFTNEKTDNEKIIKTLSEILIDFNFRLNTSKTDIGEDIVLMSIKKDKLDNIIYHIGTDKEVDVFRLKRLLLDILNTSKSYPNSGFVLKILQYFNERKFYKKTRKWYCDQTELLITILLNIAIENPRCFSVVCISIFNLLPNFSKKNQKKFFKIIFSKLSSINNVGYNEIWLQRCFYKIDTKNSYKNEICDVVNSTKKTSIFGNYFIDDKKLKTLLDKNNFINRSKLSKISKIPKTEEVNIFNNYFAG